MSQFTLRQGLYLYPTPAGAYQAVSAASPDKSRLLLQALLRESSTPVLSIDTLLKLSSSDHEEQALELLYHCQKLGWVQGLDEPLLEPHGALESLLPDFLHTLGETGKVLLADDQGFYLGYSGFAHEAAEELSALSADLATLDKRHSGLLVNNLGIASHAWALVNAFGCSQIGFWPLFVGQHRFVVAIAGVPHFNQPAFVSLVWALISRYHPKIG